MHFLPFLSLLNVIMILSFPSTITLAGGAEAMFLWCRGYDVSHSLGPSVAALLSWKQNKSEWWAAITSWIGTRWISFSEGIRRNNFK